jgi:transposase
MSTSLLNHGFGLTDLVYQKTDYKGGKIYFTVRTREDKLRCSSCSSFNIIKRGTVERQFRTLPIGLRPVYLKMQIQRLECKDCGVVRQEHLKFVDEKKATPIYSKDM